jgi:hypothetical protein
MKFTKKQMCHLPFCYAVSKTVLNRQTHILFAPDAEGPCYIFNSLTFVQQTVWETPGGTMSMVPLENKKGDFLAVQRFYPGFQAQNARIVHASFQGHRWQVKTLFNLPYVHRFDILERAGIRYVVCCTLCTSKRFEEDWSSPGGIYAAELPSDINQPIKLIQIAEGMTKNHGYWHFTKEGYEAALTSCEEGVFELTPPRIKGSNWIVNKVLDTPVSDLAVSDIDDDGDLELATIEPFHGSNFKVYRKTKRGYASIFSYPQNLPFCHVVWGGRLRSKPVFIGGCRSGNRELFMLRWDSGKIMSETIDRGCGPANVMVIPGREQDLLVAANREVGEGAVYLVQD